jgi:hypothetical protein
MGTREADEGARTDRVASGTTMVAMCSMAAGSHGRHGR